jgi:protein involved in polysaccharide export with SLBB domain
LIASRYWRGWGLGLTLLTASGCSAWKPLSGVPSNFYPQELQGEMRSSKQTIDLSLLRQNPPDSYLVDTGDTLGIVIEGVLGRPEDVPPVYYPTNNDVAPSIGYPIPVRDDGTISLPYAQPLYVRGLSIRQVEELIRKTYTLDKQILRPGEDRILVSLQRPRTYNVLVIRQEAQSQELTPQSGQAGSLLPGLSKRGTGKLVSLQAYRNDVLHALAQTGGLPGLDAENTIYVIRRRPAMVQGQPPAMMPTTVPPTGTEGWVTPTDGPAEAWPNSSRGGIRPVGYESPESQQGYQTEHADAEGWQNLVSDESAPADDGVRQAQAMQPPAGQYGGFAPALEPIPQTPMPAGSMPRGGYPTPAAPYPGTALPSGLPSGLPAEYAAMCARGAEVIRIPIRLSPGEEPEFAEGDVILQDGDIIFIESRETEVFYTGGLLGGGQYMLPRDYDLDVIEAIAIATGRTQGGGGAGFGNSIGGPASLNRDISVGASDCVILRKAGDGHLIPIKINLNKADRDPKYRVRILPGDYIVLQYKPHEAVAAFVERNLLAGGLIGVAATSGNGGGGN